MNDNHKPHLTVRDRRASDAEVLVPALAEVHRLDGYPVMEKNANAQWLFAGDLEQAWVAEFEGTCIAHLSLVRAFHAPGLADAVAPGSAPILGLTRLFVTPAGRGHGAASALIARAETYATESGSLLGLEVVDDNQDAVALYERRGWTRIHTYEASWFGETGPHPIAHVYLAPLLTQDALEQ